MIRTYTMYVFDAKLKVKMLAMCMSHSSHYSFKSKLLKMLRQSRSDSEMRSIRTLTYTIKIMPMLTYIYAHRYIHTYLHAEKANIHKSKYIHNHVHAGMYIRHI